MTTSATPTFCERHPKVETGLTCGRCETPICPKCVVMTDVGGRCPTCAPARKLPQMEIGPLYLVRALGAAVVAGGALGGVWGLLLPNSLGFFALLTGAALGYAVAESVSVATNRKFGVLLQITASAGIILAYGVRNVVSDVPIIPSGDLYGYISVGVGIVVAVNRLKG